MSEVHLPKGEKLLELEHAGLMYQLNRPINGSKQFWALKDITLDLYQGETLGVIGRNGAGKSTLMRLLAGITRQDRGRVWRRPGAHVLLLAIGLGFESALTGRENAILGGMLFGLKRSVIEKRLSRIIEFSGLGDFINQPIYTYSSGMMARLGFSVAMEVNPSVLILDEIMGVGDLDFAERSKAVLLDKIKSDMTVILISHQPQKIQDLCARAVWINDGVTQCSGPIEHVTEQYERFVYAQRGLPYVPPKKTAEAS